jgi:hypothetical protein
MGVRLCGGAKANGYTVSQCSTAGKPGGKTVKTNLNLRYLGKAEPISLLSNNKRSFL